MKKITSGQWWIKGLCLGTLAMLVLWTAAGGSNERADEMRVDHVAISVSGPETPDEMPAVIFLHDRHTEALVGKDCATCHLQEQDEYNFNFKQAERQGYEADKAIFHDNCIGCHNEMRASGEHSGPDMGQCRACHRPQSPPSTAWQPLLFDRSLHARHSEQQKIKPLNKSETTNCSACHHQYDEAAQKIVSQPGSESACIYCHTETGQATARPARAAAHDSCVACHQRLTAADQKAGPATCGGCHDAQAQAKIERLAEVPRIKRNQPDAVLLTSRWGQKEATLKERRPVVAAVDFDHKTHEPSAETCRACHHASLQKCGECHTPKGDEKGQFISLTSAMHTGDAEQSCMGCHRQTQQSKDCAGCHAQMPVKSLAQTDCTTCHNFELTIDENGQVTPAPDSAGALAAVEARIAMRNLPQALPADERIPETVVIDIMADQYQGAKFPHRKIVKALFDRSADNKMATVFHKTPETLCMGCHHNAPLEPGPPSCASCHNPAMVDESNGRPGLKGAYHVQCIGCHQQMGIEKPAATACIECHLKK